jgi:hypothetical protein
MFRQLRILLIVSIATAFAVGSVQAGPGGVLDGDPDIPEAIGSGEGDDSVSNWLLRTPAVHDQDRPIPVEKRRVASSWTSRISVRVALRLVRLLAR